MVCLKNMMQRADSVFNKRYRAQLIVTLTVNIIIFAHGIAIGWLSPTLTQLLSPDTPLDFELAIEEVSWIGALLGLGSFFGNVTFGVLISYVGLKFCIYNLALPQIGLWVLIYFANNVEYLYIARFIGGFCGGGSYVVVPIFVSEIADPQIRGTLASLLILTLNIGIVSGYILSTLLSYFTVPCIIVFLPIIFFISALFFPETAQRLLKREDVQGAEKSLKFYKSIDSHSTAQDMQQFEKDFDELKVIAKMNKENQDTIHIRDFCTKPALKGFATAGVILLVNQFCGCFAFINYMSTIFKESGSNVDPNRASIIVGSAQILGAYSATLFVDKFGRKILLLLSTAGVTIFLVLLGFYTYFAKKGLIIGFDWIPVAVLSALVFGCTMGIISLTFVVMVELFPAKIRSQAVSVCMSALSFFVFIVLKGFPIFLAYFGMSFTMWSCASITSLGFLYLVYFLKETKGISMNH